MIDISKDDEMDDYKKDGSFFSLSILEPVFTSELGNNVRKLEHKTEFTYLMQMCHMKQ